VKKKKIFSFLTARHHACFGFKPMRQSSLPPASFDEPLSSAQQTRQQQQQAQQPEVCFL